MASPLSLTATLARAATALTLSTSVAALAGIAPVWAQEAAPDSPDSAEDDKVIEFAADSMTYGDGDSEVVAEGNVLVSHGGYTLHADRVRYDRQQGIVHAEGNVSLADPNGNILIVDEIELNDTLTDGFVRNVRLLLSDDSRLAARDGERIGGTKTRVNYAVYSPCNVCESKPDKKPLWQIKAVRVTHDEEKRRLYYKNAVLEMFGVPVMWLPYLSHPDPTVERESGFLTPEIRTRRELGLVLSMPYYIAFSPSSDATITPMLTTKEGLVLGSQYRRHLGFGQVALNGSITRTDERDATNTKTGQKEIRGHLFSDGTFRHGNRWRSRYQFQWSSDDTYLRRYGFSKLDTLTSDYNAEGFYDRSYMNIRALWFRGLRIEDIQGLTPFALPLMNLDYVGNPAANGSVLRANFSTLALNRTDGLDMQRFSGNASWEIPFTNGWGQVFRAGASLRGDVYHVNDGLRTDIPVFGGEDGVTARFLPHLFASASWPFARHGASTQQVFEPIVSVVVARDGGNPVELPNEDSRTFELTDANVFSQNRFPGLDRWEGGTRISYGARWGLYTRQLTSEVVIGQSLRFNDEEVVFPQGSGISGKFSDIVGRWDIGLGANIDIAHRFRLDKDTLRIRRNEIDASIGNQNNRITIGYFQLNRNRELEGLVDREEIRASAQFRIKSSWSFFGNITQDLTDGRRPVAHGAGVMYRDECLEVSLAWNKNFTVDRDIVPGSSFNFRIRLKHLG